MTGLVGWWPLQENYGSTARDLSGNGNHGSLSGGITQGVAGKGGLTAYSFDGNDDYVDTSLSFSKRSFTYSGWVKPKNPNKDYWADLIDCYDVNDSSDWARLAYRGGDAVFFTDSGGSGGDLTELRGGNITKNWHHLVGIRDIEAGQLKLYVNAKLVNSTSTKSDGVINGSHNEVIGRRTDANNGEQVKGKLNDIRVYDRALSPQEIQTLYEWGSGDYTDRSYHNGSDPGAVSRWKFDGDVTDSWGINDGTDNTSAGYSSEAIRGQAKSFDGSNDYVDTTINTLQPPFSFFAWIKTTSISKRQVILSNYNASNDDFQFEVYNTGEVRTWGDQLPSVIKGGSISAKEWYHTGVIITTNGPKLIVNGKRVESDQSGNIGDISQSTNFYIGTQPNNIENLPFDGKIDDARIYNRALSPSEVFQLYQWGTRGRDMRKLTVNSTGEQ